MSARRWARSLIFGLAAAVFGALSAGAFVGVSPGVVELRLKPGKTHRGVFLISNNTAETLSVAVEAKETWAERTGLKGLPLDQWFTIKVPKPVKLAPGKRRRIAFKVRLPADFSGEAMALVYFSSLEKMNETGPLPIQMRHGIPVYATALGTERPALRLENPTVCLVATASGSVVGASLRVRNTGNVHVRPRIETTLETLTGSPLETFPLEYGTPIFPGLDQVYSGRGSRAAPPEGRYRAVLRAAPGDLFPGVTEQSAVTFAISSGTVQMVPPEGEGGSR